MVGDEQRWWPFQRVTHVVDQLGGIAGAGDGRQVEGSEMVGPMVEQVGVLCERFEIGIAAFGDGAVLEQVVEVLRTVGPSELSGRGDDRFGSEEQAETHEQGPPVVGVAGLGECVVDADCLGDRQLWPAMFEEELDRVGHRAVLVLMGDPAS